MGGRRTMGFPIILTLWGSFFKILFFLRPKAELDEKIV